MRSGLDVGPMFHAEAHHEQVLGADFTYSAVISADWTRPGLSAHLQFRISDEGRYGIRLQGGTITFYRFMLEDRPCSNEPEVIAHCPLWPPPGSSDDPIERSLGQGVFETTERARHISVVAEGARFIVTYGTSLQPDRQFEVQDDNLGIGRFGVYVIANERDLGAQFDQVIATTDPTAASNFVLLYSTPGYDRDGSKRAVVRTVNDLDAKDFDDTASAFSVISMAGDIKIRDRRFDASGSAGSLRRTLGFQFLAADFSDLREAGHYILVARVTTSGGIRVLRSLPFEVIPQLVTERMLWPLSTLNAKARRAADDDFRRNWFIDSGHSAWSVGLDGAFVVDRADDQGGAVLRRVSTPDNLPITEGDDRYRDFRLVVRITIVSGCDAQVQFRITHDERWAVTLQAGAAGGCQHGGGPGAVRLHREGPAVPGNQNHPHLEIVRSHLMESNPFEVGRAYDLEVRALGKRIEVVLDGVPIFLFDVENPRAGTFALKAWASTVRFGHFKVWGRKVGLSRPAPGVWIPYNRATGLSSQGFQITVADRENQSPELVLKPEELGTINLPFAAQHHGFHDCNTPIGEVTSHGLFLSSLLDIWTTRAHAATPAQQDDLRHAILTALLYLNELHEQGNRSGAFAHQEPGRVALAPESKRHLTTQFAMYGLSAFAEKGSSVDRRLARTAFQRAGEAWRWFDDNGGRDDVLDSIVAIRMARAAEREGMAADIWFDKARSAAAAVLDRFGQPGAMANMLRPTQRSMPWFEGIYEVFFRGPFTLTDEQRDQLNSIASQLSALADDPANGFCLIPQADDDRFPIDPAIPRHNWENLADLPLAVKHPKDFPVGEWYHGQHFATAAADCVYIGRLTNIDSLQRLATGNLYWILGLNPGIPTTKMARSAPTSGPWSAASFVWNGPGAFARSWQGARTRTQAAKGWLAEWETSPSSRDREIWAFDSANNGFQSIMNGHVLRERQWHYWSFGPVGWISAETFMLLDAGFLKAAILLEDWHTGSTLVKNTPYDITRPRFFDTTHLDRASTAWRFDDAERTPAAMASRMALDFAAAKGFGSARLTGHHFGEQVGVLCLPHLATTFMDIPDSEILALPFPFEDIDTAHWAQVGRAAMDIAGRRGAGAGFFTGHQVPGKKGWIGIDASLIELFDVDDATVAASQWAFADINGVGWAQAARLASDICFQRGFAGGFFTGHQLLNKRQIAAFRRS